MTLRERWENLENDILAPYAARSARSRGRVKEEEPCPIRTCFQRDRDRILHSKAFRRLKHKTQVLLLPEGDHYRTRLTHTLEVAQIARTIARALRLNEDLTEAIALGHDLGHTPFGHMGEEVLDELALREGLDGFSHARQSLRVVDILERDGRGLNLTWEVREGISQHSKGQVDVRHGFRLSAPSTYEAWVMRLSDSVAYLNHDLDDALRASIVLLSDVPRIVIEKMGDSHSKRIGNLVMDIVTSSGESGITMSDSMLETTEVLRNFLFKRVYSAEQARKEEPKVRHLLSTLFDFLLEEATELSPSGDDPPARQVLDFISGMTDRYAVAYFQRLAVPTPWPFDMGDFPKLP